MKPWTAESFARAHWKLLACFALYLTSVVLFFAAYGVGINPLNALVLLGSGNVVPASPTEPTFEAAPEEPAPEAPTAPPPQRSAIKKIGLALGIVWWLIGMGAPIIGLLSFVGIFIGVWENQLYFVRVCGVYTLVFLTAFWSIACAAQVYLQRSVSKGSAAVPINIVSLVMGLVSMVASVICIFSIRNPASTDEEDAASSFDLAILSSTDDPQMELLGEQTTVYDLSEKEEEEEEEEAGIALDESGD